MMSVTLELFLRLGKQMVVTLLIVVLVVACGGDEEPEATPTSATTPAAGGMVMPTAATVAQTDTQTATVAAAPVAPVLFIGDAVQVLPATELRLYTDATTSANVMNLYAPGERFTILDPSGDYAIYPVERDGALWYRLRAPDGLVGWSAADQLGPVQ